MVVLDTSAVIAAANRLDNAHEAVGEAISHWRGSRILPVPILSEIGYMLEVVGGHKDVSNFLRSLARGEFALDCCQEDALEAHRLVERYADMRLGLADSYVTTCAKRNGGRLVTADRRHFEPLAREFGLMLAP
ncbi:MAG TPA: PIN domain-containing protein [Chloroflexota bacterium]|nr:PIN domain-containing protein [Chloroflexota bacterium]